MDRKVCFAFFLAVDQFVVLQHARFNLQVVPPNAYEQCSDFQLCHADQTFDFTAAGMHNYATALPSSDQARDRRRTSYMSREQVPGGHGGTVYAYSAEAGGFDVTANGQSQTGHYLHVDTEQAPFRYSQGHQYFPYEGWLIGVDIMGARGSRTGRDALLQGVPDLRMSKFRVDRRFVSLIHYPAAEGVTQPTDREPAPWANAEQRIPDR